MKGPSRWVDALAQHQHQRTPRPGVSVVFRQGEPNKYRWTGLRGMHPSPYRGSSSRRTENVSKLQIARPWGKGGSIAVITMRYGCDSPADHRVEECRSGQDCCSNGPYHSIRASFMAFQSLDTFSVRLLLDPHTRLVLTTHGVDYSPLRCRVAHMLWLPWSFDLSGLVGCTQELPPLLVAFCYTRCLPLTRRTCWSAQSIPA